jgi:hypothetical protein
VSVLEPQVISRRLGVLYDDLSQSPPEAECSAAVARVYNALLAECRTLYSEDPVVKSMGAIRPQPDGTGFPTLRTVQILVGQLRAAFPESSKGTGGSGKGATGSEQSAGARRT